MTSGRTGRGWRLAAGAEGLAARMVGATITGTARRGKILWLILDERDALLTHLGMSEDDAGAASERV